MACDDSLRSNASSLFIREDGDASRYSWEGESERGREALSLRPPNTANPDDSATRQQHHEQHFSFAECAQEDSATTSPREENGEDYAAAGASASVPAEQERQLLLLMLLAQVCALHDPTPRTFTVHVLELFERGILDRQSILFLYELGLVPSISPSNLFLDGATNDSTTTTAQTTPEKKSQEGSHLSIMPVSPSSPRTYRAQRRTVEASAIRSSLEQQEQQHSFHKSQSEPLPQRHTASWSAKHHPLSLSRYQREFVEKGQLSAGAFGQVFQATNHMDGRDYAIKRVPFRATGYSRESVQQVVREVHCLAICDHPNVVRYYTSWLEPSWMTGSGASSMVPDADQQLLLKDVAEMVSSRGCREDFSADASSRLKSFFSTNKGSTENRPKRRFSFDASESSCWEENQSYWQNGNKSSFSKDDLFTDDIFDRSNTRNKQSSVRKSRNQAQTKAPRQQNYRYQICLYIQMQLCHPSTLADWIRERNNSQLYPDLASRMGPVQEIFGQIAKGLDHVHKRNIIHRDLKPANIFATVDGELQFKIGDFGLSKLIRSAAFAGTSQRKPATSPPKVAPLLLASSLEETIDACGPFPLVPQHGSHEPLTAGVGTASYASPEQINSKAYGREADIFSLGLILLELICSFDTEHERYQVFHDCRHRRIVPQDLQDQFPVLAQTILSCTESSPGRRPTASQLLGQVSLFQRREEAATPPFPPPAASSIGQNHRTNGNSDDDEVEELRRLLLEKDRRIGDLEEAAKQKDSLIHKLQEENSRLKGQRSGTSIFTYPTPQHSGAEDTFSNSSSSDNEI